MSYSPPSWLISQSLHREMAAPAPSPSAEWLGQKLTTPNGYEYMQPLGLFVGNMWRLGEGGFMSLTNPATEGTITALCGASVEDTDAAVLAADHAFERGPWRTMSGRERGACIMQLATRIRENAELLASIESWNNGKPYSVALSQDLNETIATLEYYAGWADKISGEVIETTQDKLVYTVREPLGVCAQIIPWNYPLCMLAWKLGPALATGNTVVLKPAPQTPLSALFVANLIPSCGFPPGVINIIPGGAETGKALVEHPLVRKVAFTGSTATGKTIMKLGSNWLKPITLETGGKSPLVVFPDANLPQAWRWAYEGGYGNSGQICSATTRLLVHEVIRDRFIDGFKEYIRSSTVIGDPFDPKTTMGPLISAEQMRKVQEYFMRPAPTSIEDTQCLVFWDLLPAARPSSRSSRDSGFGAGTTGTATFSSSLYSGGGTDVSPKMGYFLPPVLFVKSRATNPVNFEEIFGPVLTVQTFGSEAEAVGLANSSAYGLGAAVFTRDVARAHRVARAVRAGTVWVNSSNDADWRVPFGGFKDSGVGRELGAEGLRAYTAVKAVHVRLLEE